MAYSSSRAKDWDDILTAHTDETFARSWTMSRKKLGSHSLGFVERKGKKALGSVKVNPHTAIDFYFHPLNHLFRLYV